MDDADKDPAVVIMFLVGRVLKSAEIHDAFGLSRSGYRKAQAEGRLVTPDNLMRVARHFDLNYIELLTRFGQVPIEAVTDFVESDRNFTRLKTRRPVTRVREAQPRTDVSSL